MPKTFVTATRSPLTPLMDRFVPRDDIFTVMASAAWPSIFTVMASAASPSKTPHPQHTYTRTLT